MIEGHAVGVHAVADDAGITIRATVVQFGIRDLVAGHGTVQEDDAGPIPGRGRERGRGECGRVLGCSDRDQPARIGVADVKRSVGRKAKRDTRLDGERGVAIDED